MPPTSMFCTGCTLAEAAIRLTVHSASMDMTRPHTYSIVTCHRYTPMLYLFKRGSSSPKITFQTFNLGEMSPFELVVKRFKNENLCGIVHVLLQLITFSN